MLVSVGNRIPEDQKPAYMRRPTHGCPIDKLPDDILLEIFLIGVAVQLELRDNREDGGWGPNRNDFQEVMSYVCTRWRNIAVNAPLLWRRLEFGDGPPFPRTIEYIRRSRDGPLEIVFDCTRVKQRALDYFREEWDWTGCGDDITKPRRQTYFFDLVDPRDISDILDLVLPHVARWRLFKLNTDNYTALVRVLKAISSVPEAPALETLSLVFSDEYFTGDEQQLEVLYVPFSGIAPRLQDLELVKVSLDWTRCKFLQPGSVLTRLKMHYHPPDSRPTPDSFFRWLEGAPPLDTLQLRDSGPVGDPEQWPNVLLELRSVTRLYLEHLEHAALAALLPRLQFPKLRTLTLKIEDWHGDKTTELLCDHVPLERLHELDVNGLLISTLEDNERFWGSLRRLRMLRISEETAENSLFGAVWKRPGTMPRLHTLMTSGVEADTLKALVRGRRRAARRLETLRVHKADKVSRAQEKWLKQNVDFAYFGDPELDGSESESESEEDVLRYVSDPERYDDKAWMFRTMSP